MRKRRVPVDLLYVRYGEMDGKDTTGTIVPVVCHRPLMSLCRHVIDGADSLDSYWGWAEREYTVRDREAHIADWKRRSRWIRLKSLTPRPTVAVLDRDRLVLESGAEQACFAKAVDRRWMWVDMPDEVANSWDQRSTDTLNRVVRETGRKEFYNPVLHEEYRRARITRPDSIRIDRVRRVFGADGPGLRGLDIGCNMGYTSHMFQRHGANMTGVDFDKDHLSVARALDITYGLGTEFVNCQFEEFQATEDFDIVILLTVMYHTLIDSENEAIRMIKHIDRLSPAVLVWESGSNMAREIDLILRHSGLSTYLPLGQTKATGKDREMGIFVRPGTALGESVSGRYESDLAEEFAGKSIKKPADLKLS